MKKDALRVVATLPVAPTTLYFAWLNSEQHGAMTGGTAKIDPTVGSKYSAWNGYITGKLVVLDLGRRIVMSWRTTDFPRDSADSKVEVHFEALGGSTRVTILHTEIPEGQGEKYRKGWNDNYFGPMLTYFTKYLPDPRKPPPVRKPPPPMDDDDDDQDARPMSKLAQLKAKAAAAKGKPPGPTVAKAPPSKKPVVASAQPPSKTPASKAPASKAPASKAPASKAPASKAPASKAPPSKKPALAKKPAAPAKKPAAKKPAAKKPAPPAKKKKKK
jgi:uncharacterized protein YndB with AHSA1/START domain